MKVLDLFSGIGGFSLGLEAAGFETAAFCEYDQEAQKVLQKNWPNVPIFSDVRTLTKQELHDNGIYDIGLICGGYPCQPFSLAGERRGAEDDRHLWPEMFRLVQELRPNWVIGENVAGHINMGLDEVLTDLEAASYTTRPFVIPACAVDAPHRRDRVWIIAHANSDSESNGSQHEQRMVENTSSRSRGNSKGFVRRQDYKAKRSQDTNKITGSSQNVADSERWTSDSLSNGRSNEETKSKQRQKTRHSVGGSSGQNVADTASIRQSEPRQHEFIVSSTTIENRKTDYALSISKPELWRSEPNVGRVADGVPRRSHRLKQLGNAVVPQVVERIGKAIWEIEKQ
jgi:DNA (cytosine-5)-methyltransferase 1